ncbi:MAG: 4'-phosphopantetheinyl transferase superfamily protein [Rikenellaceae bacterium]
MSNQLQHHLLHLDLPSGGVLVVSPICSLDEVLSANFTQENLNQKRLCERFSWHKIAREMLNDPAAQFTYNDVGAPQIAGSELYISVSHSSSLVAVLISPERCAVDIENLDRNFEKVASRYVSPSEALISDDKKLLPQLWSIKEALYKFAGCKGVDFVADICVQSVDCEVFTASVLTESDLVCGAILQLHDHILAYIG